MLRSWRASPGAFAVVLACLAGACSSSSMHKRTHATGGESGGEDESLSAGAPASDGGDASGGRLGSGGAGASGSPAGQARRVFYLDVQGRVLAFDEDTPTPRTLVSSAGQGPDGLAVD